MYCIYFSLEEREALLAQVGLLAQLSGLLLVLPTLGGELRGLFGLLLERDLLLLEPFAQVLHLHSVLHTALTRENLRTAEPVREEDSI